MWDSVCIFTIVLPKPLPGLRKVFHLLDVRSMELQRRMNLVPNIVVDNQKGEFPQ